MKKSLKYKENCWFATYLKLNRWCVFAQYRFVLWLLLSDFLQRFCLHILTSIGKVHFLDFVHVIQTQFWLAMWINIRAKSHTKPHPTCHTYISSPFISTFSIWFFPYPCNESQWITRFHIDTSSFNIESLLFFGMNLTYEILLYANFADKQTVFWWILTTDMTLNISLFSENSWSFLIFHSQSYLWFGMFM